MAAASSRSSTTRLTHDDQVDALSIIGQMLDVMVPPKVTNVVRVPQLPRDYVQAHELERDDGGYSWKTA